MKSPIFIFSLPRSGSTLLQRILMGHPKITSIAEPWILLPFIYAHKKNGTISEFSHRLSLLALQDFIANLPNAEKDYYTSLNCFISSLYGKLCSNGEIYFLDKTPRYYNIIPEINQIFPTAKYIFLFRNPVQVLSSILNTWCKGRFNSLYAFYRDIYIGPKLLSKGFKLIKDSSYAVQYEEFIVNPQKYTKKICQYLEIEFSDIMLKKFATQNTYGRMGDTIGTKRYLEVNKETVGKWKDTFASPYRKKILSSYIKSFDNEILENYGDKIYVPICLAKIKGTVKDDSDSLFLPAPGPLQTSLFLPQGQHISCLSQQDFQM